MSRFRWAIGAVAVLVALGAAGWVLTRPEPPSSPASPDPKPDTKPDPKPDAKPDPKPDTKPDLAATVRMRIVAANLSSGRHQSYDPGHGARILDALDPDVVLFQELNVGDGSDAALKRFVVGTLGTGFHVHRETGAQIPNGIASRWPFREVGVWEDPLCPNREWVWARIDIPGPTDLWAVSLHLLTRNPATREKQATGLAAYVRKHVPESDFLVIGGDLNTRRNDEPALKALESLVSLRHEPRDARGKRGTNASRKRPYDWVLPDRDLEAYHVTVEVGGHRFEHGLVFDSRVFEGLDAVSPVRRGDSGANQMQHMAIVRDFVIPSAE